jgi:hypothetical protein
MYGMVIAACGSCGRMMTFHPRYVPSLHNIPFCRECIEQANEFRVENGLEPISIHPRAYDNFTEEEL